MIHAPFRRTFLATAGAGVLAALLAACGPGGPKRATDDGGGGTPTTTALSLVAGNATLTGTANAKGDAARFKTPRGIAIDSAGNLYVADQDNFVIRKIATDGTVSTFAGGMGVSGNVNDNGTRARFVLPTALAIDGSGNLFVADGGTIRKITPGADVSTVNANAVATTFDTANTRRPAGIAVDGSGNLYVTAGAETRRIASSYRTFTTLETGGVDVLAPDVVVPRGVTVDSGGTVWVADLNRTLSSAAGNASVLTRFVGTPGVTGANNGTNMNASFQQVVGLTVDPSGNLYAADAVNNLVRKITPDRQVTTVAGTQNNSTLRTGGLPGSLAPLAGITTDGKGVLYATSGNAVVKIVLP